MRRLFDHWRPQIDETSLRDEVHVRDASRSAAPARWQPTLLAVVILVLGLALLSGAVLIGVHVDGRLAETISTRRSEIWAWVPMLFMSLGGVGLALFAVGLLRGISSSYSTTRKRR
ncbi:hypothetical protein [Microbacterium sp. H83]|uniref:hypothetical protein n=1 Tax=Microbacterium sp. H83 TaxID=1827324 RepID=UPI0007F4C294|nr:hypothetical protein [Microbacterium sp. H83]OAN40962.1 hypothetical protein A4X16_02190 [Microbacterium sp. H83]